MLSSISMIKIGKVFENLMIDMRATNAKLRRRALRIVMEGGQVPNYLAEAKLQEADGDVKLAILLARTELSVEQAKHKLKQAEGVLYKAIGDMDHE